MRLDSKLTAWSCGLALAVGLIVPTVAVAPAMARSCSANCTLSNSGSKAITPPGGKKSEIGVSYRTQVQASSDYATVYRKVSGSGGQVTMKSTGKKTWFQQHYHDGTKFKSHLLIYSTNEDATGTFVFGSTIFMQSID